MESVAKDILYALLGYCAGTRASPQPSCCRLGLDRSYHGHFHPARLRPVADAPGL